ncbi:hypothetical protein [Pedococcus sp.]|uniref:hypothetical protein n=1 Tax=Pedococcus sp. TaxID=2860345 RepID=UPI002E106A83|nr:hypothetical protein [Pedococcus sp.]
MLMVIVGASLSMLGACAADVAAPRVPVLTGGAAPVVEVAGTAMPSKGQALLLSFLDLGPSAGAASRSQLAVVKSMATQYSRAGLSIAVVDTSGLSQEQLVNVGYDWDLHYPDLHLLPLSDAKGLVRLYQPKVPDTTLIAPDGTVQARWQGVVVPAQALAPPLKRLQSP